MASSDLEEHVGKHPWEYCSLLDDHPLVKELFDRRHDYPDLPVKFTVGLFSEVESDIKTEPTEIEIGKENLTLSGNVFKIDWVRYMVPRVTDNILSILISVRNSDETPYSFFYTVKPSDGYEAVSILNLIRKSLFDKATSEAQCDPKMAVKAIDFNRVLFSDNLECSVTSQPNAKEFYVVIDQECMCFFFKQYDSAPCTVLFFWKERGNDVIERVMMINDTREIRFESESSNVLVKDQRNIDEFKRVIAKNSSKPKEIFHGYPALVRHLDGSSRISKETAVPGPSHDYGDSKDEGYKHVHPQAGKSATILRDEFDEAIDSLMSAEERCRKTELYETISLQWIVIQDEIADIQISGLVPPSDFLSGGLDPDDPDHFRKCLQDLEENLMTNQRYDIALSHVAGMKTIFNTNITSGDLRRFIETDDINFLRMVYYRSYLGLSS
ncbi:uncharacterized protein LOC125667495 isoform X2 [Ostrea edulis]|uniref:uncharacterized protein LOC125667495 isoform X2 n=1 Tax=Ostrea edulis TaxID=37623 RepID=UPI0024AF7129|nr:uncharacterized protein LOC125667495 isoform X2 [Ostrea edulis]XP_056008100.1 uncharacterized protein LOC125667495 isoform X2 [Ostrea edulis]